VPADGRSVDHAEQRPDRQLSPGLQPWVELSLRPPVHADLTSLAALATAHQDRAAGGVEVALLRIERLAAHVLATVVELNQKAACRAVVVTALTDRARTWWDRLGFHPFDPDEPNQLDVYLLTAEIDTTLRRLQ